MSKNTSTDKQKIVLVAEDDKFYSHLYETKLTNEGFNIVIAEDGIQVVKLAKLHHPALVLLDLIMPTQDGFETLKILKSDPELAKIPVVIMSNLAQEEDMQRTKELGAIDYLVKANITMEDMVKVVRKYLE